MSEGLSASETEPVSSSCEQNQLLSAVVAYENVTVGKHAMQLLGRLSLGEAGEIQAIPWSFNVLEDCAWQKLAMQDVVKTDMLVIVTNGLRPITPAVLRWLETAIGQLRGKEAAIVFIRCAPDFQTNSDKACHPAIQSAVQKAGLVYFTTSLPSDSEEFQQCLQHRADMVTPVLDKILHQETSFKLKEKRN